MSFEIKRPVGASIDDILFFLHKNLSQSRFTAEIRLSRNGITIHNIRLREAKHYCGNHPYPCPVTPWEKRHVKAKFLEGADWVAWNDMLNDICDDLEVSADISSSLVIIRKGRKRCVRYDGFSRGNGYEWVKDSGCFKDMIGKPHEVSDYPEGTPGNSVWKLCNIEE